MKNSLKIFLAFVVVLFAANSSIAQKVGYINADLLITAMPERDSALKKLDTFKKESEEMYESMTAEFTKKANDLEAKRATLTGNILAQKEKELQDLYQRIQAYPQIVQQDQNDMAQKLFTPIQERAVGAIKKVAKANGFAYILNEGDLLYLDETQIVDILPMVKKELGLK